MKALLRAGLFAGLALHCAPLLPQEQEEAELARLERAIAGVREEISAARGRQNELNARIQQSETRIVELRRGIGRINGEIAEAERQLDELRERQRQLESQRAEQQALIEQYLLSAWRGGRDSTLKLLLNQEDPALGSRMLRYYQYFSEARGERIEAFRQTLASLEEVSTDISEKTRTLSTERQKLLEEQQRMNDSQQQRQQLLAELDNELRERGAELSGLERQQAEIELVLEEIRKAVAELQLGDSGLPFGEMKGSLPWPVDGSPANRFGSKHPLGDLTWEGVNIRAEAGAEVRAVHHGRVRFADWLGSSGLLLIIDHGDGYMSLYAHNQELYKTVGDWVGGGEAIAAAGNTGGQRETGLYFEIRRNGEAENPVSWFAPRP